MIDTSALQKLVWESFEKKRKVFPCHTNRASDIGHPCDRYLVFSRTRWQDKLLPEVELQMIFEEGNFQEEVVKKTLQDAGFILTQQQRGYFEAPQQISGHLDIFIQHSLLLPEPVPAEIKGLSQYNWESIDSMQDMVNHKAWYIRKYPAQLMTYLYMNNLEEGLWILKNKQNGKLKFIYCLLDFAYMESLLQKAERINALVAENGQGEPIDDLSCCQSCPFRHICFKDQTFGSGMIILDDGQINARMATLESLKANFEEYAKTDEEIKAQIKERLAQEPDEALIATIMAGNYVFQCNKIRPAGRSPYWKINNIQKV